MPAAPRVSVYYRTREGYWTVRWRENKRQREVGSFQTENAAHDYAHTIRQRLRTGLPGVRPPRPIADLLQEWWDGYVTTGNLSEATRTNYRTSTRRILHEIGDWDANTTRAHQITVWADTLESEIGPRLTNACLTVLSSAYQRGVEWGTIEENPVRHVRKRREPAPSVLIPTRQEAMRLGMTADKQRDRNRLLIAAYAGLRPAEQTALEWRHLTEAGIRVEQAVDLRGNLKSTKTGKPRTVPIPQTIRESLEAWHHTTPHPKPRDPIFPSKRGTRLSATPWRRDVWYPWRERAEVPHLSWRTLRHFYASQVAAAGASILQCSRWMGHGSIRTTMDRYGVLFDEDAERVMRALQ